MPADIHVKSVLNKTKRRDPWFLDDYTINPYSGCSFNCLFCYIRGSKYGENMEDKLAVKANALEVLEKQLRNRAAKGQYGIIVLSSATDPYLHFEAEQQLTRRVLELVLKYRFPLHVITRSSLVLRDLDLLTEIGRHAILPADLETKLQNCIFVTFSFSTVDDAVARIFEPGAPSPSQRLPAMSAVRAAGIATGVSMMPMLPYITDTTESLNNMFAAFSSAGARYIFPATITLFGNGPSDSRTLVLRAVAKHYPHLLEKYERFFVHGKGIPAYYSAAFARKAAEMGSAHGLANSLFF